MKHLNQKGKQQAHNINHLQEHSLSWENVFDEWLDVRVEVVGEESEGEVLVAVKVLGVNGAGREPGKFEENELQELLVIIMCD